MARFVGPGVELIALDPKISVSLLGSEVLSDADVQAAAARLLAVDVGIMNQEACVNSRVAYVDVTGVSDPEAAVRSLAEAFFARLQELPLQYTSPVDHLPLALRDEMESAMLIGNPR